MGSIQSGTSFPMRLNTRAKDPMAAQAKCWFRVRALHLTGSPISCTNEICPTNVTTMITQKMGLSKMRTRGLSCSFLRMRALMKLKSWKNTKALKKKVKWTPFS